MIAGAEGWEEIPGFGEAHLDELKCYGDFENGIPRHNTIARVIASLNSSQMQTCFSESMKSCHILTEGILLRLMERRFGALTTRVVGAVQSI
ncbi:hypothetical protein GCM10026986_33870 [Nitrincola alkalisediminis]